ncbi:ABC transporter substrate-binding protein [Limnohabitans sp. MMS-10A-160]|jgi:tripartite-type tricarboxylate transporter receptor subunit TctC|uniref:Bug family tripartite tricarboxylate transporter substrate binding protein n=1 Tax=unclassified Limnohabitans TaxID=2626134 RepID=UPI000D3C5A0E|nr:MULTISPECIES: tripartite tricarboxylate transporter substrate binding protein [unclassified Limnohabitans]PUE14373.1 ABC transporter substrate-binding protein [Limnohabitans sp. MMS-10A-192]PUE24526.1 ABC transporter substrate-binding protein [Limnohabitans sp. MMS-10A-160]
MNIIRCTRRALLAALLPLVATTALADAWPSRPIKLVVPFPAGGPTDTASRILGQKLAERLKQPVVVENRAGASGSIAAKQVMDSPADGYTLMMLATPTLLAPHIYKKTGYDTVKNFTPVATIYDLPIVVVVNPAQMPSVTDVQRLITHAKARPGQINYTSSGPGSFGHLSMELLKELGQFDMQHVPYKGGVPAITDTIGGRVPVMYADLVAALPHIQSGKLRAIAVGSPQRVAMLPQVKTIAEQGFKGFDAVSWGGLLAPLGTPKEVVARLNKEVTEILADKAVQEKMLTAGAIANYQSAERMAARIQGDYDKWGRVIRNKSIGVD